LIHFYKRKNEVDIKTCDGGRRSRSWSVKEHARAGAGV